MTKTTDLTALTRAAGRPPSGPAPTTPPGTRLSPTPKLLVLRDGTPVRIRPITPEDKERLSDTLWRLSDRSRYLRFMHAVTRLSPRELRYLTEIDYDSHMALVAVDATSPAELGLGVARFIRLEKEPEVAEVAIAVVDSHQGRGLGTILLGELTLEALRRGVRSFRAHVLAENHSMVKLFLDLGASVRRGESGVLLVDMAIPEDLRELPDSPAGRVFKAIASQDGSQR